MVADLCADDWLKIGKTTGGDRANFPSFAAASIFMKRNLDYFKTFLDEPETLDDEEFKRKLKQWMNFYKANRKKIDFETDEMQDRLEVMIENLKSRFRRTPEIEEEWDKLYAYFGTIRGDEDYAVKSGRLLLDFMEEYRWHFGFTPKQIAEQKKAVRHSEKALDAFIRARKNSEKADLEYEEAVRRFDESLAAYIEQTGKIPVLTALPSRKKHTGN